MSSQSMLLANSPKSPMEGMRDVIFKPLNLEPSAEPNDAAAISTYSATLNISHTEVISSTNFFIVSPVALLFNHELITISHFNLLLNLNTRLISNLRHYSESTL